MHICDTRSFSAISRVVLWRSESIIALIRSSSTSTEIRNYLVANPIYSTARKTFLETKIGTGRQDSRSRQAPRLIFIPLTGTGRFFRFPYGGGREGGVSISFLLHISLDGNPIGRDIAGALSMRIEFLTALSRVSRNSKESGREGRKKGEEEEVSGSISKSAT